MIEAEIHLTKRPKLFRQTEPPLRAGLLAITVLLCVIVLIAIGTLVARPATPEWTDVALIVLTLILSWLFANTVFAVHYIHLFCSQEQGKDLGGLEVPNTPNPWVLGYNLFQLHTGNDLPDFGYHDNWLAYAEGRPVPVYGGIHFQHGRSGFHN
ncbi:DUF1345 domain-containing protein [Agrobacterium sp. CR_3]